MERFLRDENINNLTINEDSLIRISDDLLLKADSINKTLPENGAGNDKQQIVTFIIRLDNKGYRFYHIDDVLRHYRTAKKVERIVITMESIEAIKTNRIGGTHIEVRFDINDKNNCLISVSSDNSDFVESSYSTVSEVIESLKNKNGLIRNGWTPFIVQITGVILGFIFSLWAAMKIAPQLKIESPFFVSVLFTFLVFSNVWTYLNQQILNLLSYCFPNILFSRKGKDNLHWLMQTIIGGIVLAITLYLINMGLGYIGRVLGQFIEN
jgi:hypothetical protein